MSLKQSFIIHCLTDYNQSVIETMRAEMRRMHVGVTDQGYQSLAYKVFQSGNEGAYSELSFNEYLRMVDMGAGRGHPLGGLKSVSIALKASKQHGLKSVKNNKRRKKKIYSRIAYGKLPHLTGKLLYGYTDEVIKELKATLQSTSPKSP